jgi:hypothetical protein
VLGQLHEAEIDLLQIHRFIYLTNLSIYVDPVHVDNFMRIIAFISFNLTDLTLIFSGTVGINTPRKVKYFNSLKNLTLQGLPSVAYSLDMLPTAPQLESLQLTSLSLDIGHAENISLLFTAVANYAKRSRFTKLLLGITHFRSVMYGTIDINLVILSEIDRLTDLALTIDTPSSVVFPDGRPMVWGQLRTLNLTLGRGKGPAFSLESFLNIASQAPHLTDATARMDLRAAYSPVLQGHFHPAEEEEDSVVESNLVEGSIQNIEQLRTMSLRNLNFNMSHLRREDQGFLFATLRDLTPNLGISMVTLDSLSWHNPASRDTATRCIKTHKRSTPPSAVEFAVLLCNYSDLFAM